MNPKTAALLSLVILGVSLALVLPGRAQYREYYFYGRVVDTQKTPLEGVDIALRDVETSRSYVFRTNKKGEFKFAGLPHGVYKVVFKKDGYAVKEDEWRFQTPQEMMQKTEIPDVVLVSLAQVEKQAQLKEMQGTVKEAADKIKQKDYDGAVTFLKAALDKTPDDVNALYLLGIAYSRKKMYPEAIDALSKVTGTNPKFAPAVFELAVCYQQENDTDKALELYKKTAELDPANPDAAYNSGLILFGKGQAGEALAFFEKALALRPSDPAYLEMAGRCAINQGDFAKALDYLEKARTLYADPDRVKFLDELIAKLKEQTKK